VTVTNLFSGTSYRFRVYAKNGVSSVAQREGVPSKYTELEVTTLESGIKTSVLGFNYQELIAYKWHQYNHLTGDLFVTTNS